MRYRDGSESGYVRRYLVAVLGAMLLAFVVAVPVFAQEETTAEEPATGEDGGTVQPQVIGGDPVDNGKFEFVAAVRDVTRGNTVREQHFCGGALLDDDSVLTAAHCMESVTSAQLRVTVGRAKLDSDQGQTRRVTAIARHPRYTNSLRSFRYDAAVLELARPIDAGTIEPVTIPQTKANGPERPGTRLTVAGWGNTVKQDVDGSQPDRFPQRMQEAQVPVVSDDKAKRVYESGYAKALMVAAGREGKDTCQGDSGGPMFIKKDSGAFRQIGITSFGNGCGAKGNPGVYAETNAPAIRSFIVDAADL